MTYISARHSTRHYVRKASAWNFWFDFMYNKTKLYYQLHGDNFCLVINNSDIKDKAYILPFKMVKAYFNEKNLEADGRRWVGTIINNQLKLGPAEASIPVGQYYNRFDLLDPKALDEQGHSAR
jgi:hypothetical protein